MMDETPIVTLGEIAKFLKVGEKKARRIINRHREILLLDYLPTLAVLPSALHSALQKSEGTKMTVKRL